MNKLLIANKYQTKLNLFLKLALLKLLQGASDTTVLAAQPGTSAPRWPASRLAWLAVSLCFSHTQPLFPFTQCPLHPSTSYVSHLHASPLIHGEFHMSASFGRTSEFITIKDCVLAYPWVRTAPYPGPGQHCVPARHSRVSPEGA